jgi:hypothetical protein
MNAIAKPDLVEGTVLYVLQNATQRSIVYKLGLMHLMVA